jgi:hypothetical protein
MNDIKAWYSSRTVWGGLVAIAGACAALFGREIRPDEAAGLVEGLAALASAGGGLLAIFGRIAARKRLG